MVLLAREEVDGFGGRDARKSPYAGDSCSLTSESDVSIYLISYIFISRRYGLRGQYHQ